MNWKVGEWVFVPGMFIFAKIVSIRETGSTVTLYLKHSQGEISMSSLKHSNMFVLKSFDARRKIVESSVIKVSSLINGIGVILLGCIALHFFG